VSGTHIYWYALGDGSWGGCANDDLVTVDCDELSPIERAMIDRAMDTDNDDLVRFAILRAYDRIEKEDAA
jgi:hypothetical protein